MSESPDEIYGGSALETLAAAPRYQSWIFEQIQPGGKLLLFIPAMEFLFSKLDQEFGRTYKDGKNIRAHHLFGIIGVMFSTLMRSRRS